jgi:peptide chain release factor 3
MRVFAPGEDRHRHDADEIIDGLANPALAQRFGAAYEQAAGEIELVREATPPFDEAAFLAGR